MPSVTEAQPLRLSVRQWRNRRMAAAVKVHGSNLDIWLKKKKFLMQINHFPLHRGYIKNCRKINNTGSWISYYCVRLKIDFVFINCFSCCGNRCLWFNKLIDTVIDGFCHRLLPGRTVEIQCLCGIGEITQLQKHRRHSAPAKNGKVCLPYAVIL